MANEILFETIEMARNLINQVPCFLFTLESLELRQGLNLLEIVSRNSNFIYCRRFRREKTTRLGYSKPSKQDPWTKSKQMKVLVEEKCKLSKWCAKALNLFVVVGVVRRVWFRGLGACLGGALVALFVLMSEAPPTLFWRFNGGSA